MLLSVTPPRWFMLTKRRGEVRTFAHKTAWISLRVDMKVYIKVGSIGDQALFVVVTLEFVH